MIVICYSQNFDAMKPALRGCTAQLARGKSALDADDEAGGAGWLHELSSAHANSNDAYLNRTSLSLPHAADAIPFLRDFARGLSLEEQGRSCLFCFRDLPAAAIAAVQPDAVSMVREEKINI